MDEDEAHTEGVQERDVVDQVRKAGTRHRFAAEAEDEGAPPVGVEVGSRAPEELDEVAARGLSGLAGHGDTTGSMHSRSMARRRRATVAGRL